ISQLALMHDENDDAAGKRENFSRALIELDQWFDASREKAGANVVGTQQPFYLAYNEVNNRELLSRYGDLCGRLMHVWQETEYIAPLQPPQAGPIRVGIVSGQVRNHSVWHAIVK